MKRLTIRLHVSNFNGYGIVGCELFHHLSAAGVFCSLRPIAIDESFGPSSKVSAQMRAQVVNTRQPEDWEVLLAPPHHDTTPGRKTLTFTMYESTEMPESYIARLNAAECVVVPCHWNKKSFEANGVTKPIHVVSLGFDPHVFKPSPVAEHGPCIFGVAGRTRHCARRKGVQEAIDLFLKTFPGGEENVRLHVKIHADDTIAEVKDHRIKVTRHNFEPYEIAQWLSGLTAFLTLSRGEGFGLWPLQALASGRPVIGCSYGGHADFMTDVNSFIVPHRVVDAVSGESNVEYLGHWAQPDEKTAAKIMLSIYKNRSLAVTRGAAAPAMVKGLTWENTAKNFIDVLEGVGAL